MSAVVAVVTAPVKAVAQVVAAPVKAVANVVEKTVDVVGDALEDTWDVVVDAADWTVDTAKGVVQGALDDPIKTIAQVAAVATGQYYLLPAIAAADVAAAGGDIKDIAKAAAISYATQAVAAEIGGQVGSGITVDDAGIPLLPADAAYHAASGVAGMTGSQAAGNASAGAANNAFNAAVRGGDLDQILKSAISGGVSGGTSTVLGEMGVPRSLMPVAGGAIAGGTSALLYGQDVADSILRGAAIGGANSALSMAGGKLKQLYAENKDALASYFKSTEEYKTAAEDANEYRNGTYQNALDNAKSQEEKLNGIQSQFQKEKSEYERLLDSYEKNKDLYNSTKNKSYADAANALVDDIEAAADKANKSYDLYEKELSVYEKLKDTFDSASKTYDVLVDKANTINQTASDSIQRYEDSYGKYVNESLVFNKEMSEFSKDVVAKYVENTGEVPTPELLEQYINSGKGAEDIAKDIQTSDMGQRWNEVQNQFENTSKILGSGLYNYQDTSNEYINKAEEAFASRNSDLGMYYQYKAFENEAINNPNGIYAKDEVGNIIDLVNGVTYEKPTSGGLSEDALNALDIYRTKFTGDEDPGYVSIGPLENYRRYSDGTIALPPVFVGAQPEEGVGSVGDGEIMPKEITFSEERQDGTTVLKYSDGSTELFNTKTGELISDNINFYKNPSSPSIFSESAYAQALGNAEELPSWMQTWLDASSQGYQKDTGYASSLGMSLTPDGTYKDTTGNEYKKVTISGKEYLQDIDNPTGLYAVDGTGKQPGDSTTGIEKENISDGFGVSVGDGSGVGGELGVGVNGVKPGSGAGTGSLSGALAAAEYISKNDLNKDGVVNAADTIEATFRLSNLYKRGEQQQRQQQLIQTAVTGMRKPMDLDSTPPEVVQGDQAELGSLNTFTPEENKDAATQNKQANDLYFDSSQVINNNPFGTLPQASSQPKAENSLYFDDSEIRRAAEGGQIEHNPQFFSEGGLGTLDNRYVKGEGDGTSDSVPAMLASGEFVIPADVVSGLGNGDNDAGAAVLDEFMKAIRTHKRAADPSELPEDSKGPLAYLQEAMKKVRK